ncbi:unnamed protein product [Didymodactylos carnosus]|uniref:HIT-type domain-containing protein n=1 Tax=Didymodactylos carnosus TaxID=1234261 RepID=A0A8S2D2P8_9BILA|nr:unnamed protein product [Didymodactylos carnosus]CAF3613393.1 unnamed protein product [Didymodactylos carnosus]
MLNPSLVSPNKKCIMCKLNTIKYTCPRCQIKTCSLDCCLKHKKHFKCNGQRDRVSFKSLTDMNDLDLLSDYRLLEEINRRVEITKRDHFIKSGLNEQTRYQKLIQTKLKTEHQIQVLFLPKFSTKHKSNKMWMDKVTNEIYWHIECKFFINDEFYEWTTIRIPTSKTTLKQILLKFHSDLIKTHLYVDISSDNEKELSERLNELSSSELQSLREKNFFKDLNQLSVWIENFGIKRKGYGHYEEKSQHIDFKTDTIDKIFKDRTIIEYPTLFISLTDDTELMRNKLNKSERTDDISMKEEGELESEEEEEKKDKS